MTITDNSSLCGRCGKCGNHTRTEEHRRSCGTKSGAKPPLRRKARGFKPTGSKWFESWPDTTPEQEILQVTGGMCPNCLEHPLREEPDLDGTDLVCICGFRQVGHDPVAKIPAGYIP